MVPNVSAWSIRRPLPAIVMSMIFVVLGAVSFGALPITRLPDVDLPVVSIAVTQFGAAPAELVAQVSRPIEDAVSDVPGIRHVISSVVDGSSITVVQFQPRTNIERALNDVKDAVERIRTRLPQDSNEPIVQSDDAVGLPIVTYVATASGKTLEQLSAFIDDVVRRELRGVRGVGRVERIGGVDREISVALDPDRLQALGLTAADVSQQLRGTRIDLASGGAKIGGREQSIRTLGAATTIGGIAASMISLPSGRTIRLDDLGTVTNAIVEPRSFARFDGKSVVGFSVLRSKSSSDDAAAAGIARKVADLGAAYGDVDFRSIESTTDFTYGTYRATIQILLEIAALAVLVVLVVLRDVRAMLIAAVVLPLSMLPAFWAMDVLGISLNLVSMLAITVSAGILVDDSIVEIESVERHLAAGTPPFRAALDAAAEVGPAVIAIGLAIIAVFVSLSLTSSVAAPWFKQFGVTIAVLVFSSLLVARLVTPMLAAYVLAPRTTPPQGPASKDRPPGPIMRLYSSVLRGSVRHCYVTVAIGLLLVLLSGFSTRWLPSGFLPPQDIGHSLLAIELPPGSLLSTTEDVTESIARRLRTRPEVASVLIEGGRVPPSSADVRKATLTINYTPKDQRVLTQRQLEHAISADLATVPDIRSWFLDENGRRGVALVVTGQDAATVGNVAAELVSQMHRIPIVANVVSSASLDRPELLIRPRLDLAARLGISTESLSQTIRVATIGDIAPALARLDTGDREIPIRVRLDASVRSDLQRLEELRVPIPGGRGAIPLASVADVTLERGPINITRYDREIQAAVGADLADHAVIGEAMAEIEKLPVMTRLPPGISVKPSGDAEDRKTLADGFEAALGEGLLAMFVLLVLLFASVVQPVTVLLSLPLAIGGAVLGLLVAHIPFSAPVAFGILMVVAIAAKNTIMLVHFTVLAIKRGVARDVAAIEAGQRRARPIAMTAIAIVVAMLPAIFAPGVGGEIRSPMAIAVIGGLVVSMLTSLIFVPAMFLVVDDVGRVFRRCGAKIIGPRTGEVG